MPRHIYFDYVPLRDFRKPGELKVYRITKYDIKSDEDYKDFLFRYTYFNYVPPKCFLRLVNLIIYRINEYGFELDENLADRIYIEYKIVYITFNQLLKYRRSFYDESSP